MSLRSYASFVVHHSRRIIFLCFIAMLAIGYFMQFVAPSVSWKDMLGEDNPNLKKYDFMQAEYTNDDNLLVFIEAIDGNPFTRSILGGVVQLTDALWRTPHAIRVDSVTNYQHTQAEGDLLTVGDLVVEPHLLSDEALEEIRDIAIAEPLTVNRVVNQTGNVLAINVSFAFPQKQGDEKLNSDAFVQEHAAAFRKSFPETRVYVGGLTALDATVMKISMKESGMFLVLVMFVVIVLMGLLLRTFKAVSVSVLIFGLSIMSGMALSGMLGWKLTPFTSSVPMIILIIAVADCVHFITSFVRKMQAGVEKRRALIHALETNFKAILITSLTTSIGFLTLNFSQSQSIGALGSQSAFGVMAACVLSLSLLPAMLSLLNIRVNKQKSLDPMRFTAATEFLYRNRFRVLVMSFLVAVFLGFSATKNEFNDRIPTYFAESLPWRQANDFSEAQFGGAYTFGYSLHGKGADTVANPAFLGQVEGFVEWLRAQPEVAYVNAITDTFKRLNKNMNGDDPGFYRLPENQELAAQYLLLYEMSLPYGLDLNNQINLDKSGTKVLAAFKTMSTKEVLAMEEKVNDWTAKNLEDLQVVYSGVQIMFAHLLDQDTKGLTMGAVSGLLLISFLLIFIVKSVRVGTLSVLPNILPALFAFGVWGLLVGQIGMGLAMVSGMSIGIIVDDTVHFLLKYLTARREKGMNAKESVAHTFETVGPSIVFTTIVLIAGFSVMAFLSEFRVNTDMGKMTSIIMAFALLFDLVTLPVLLMIFDRKKTWAPFNKPAVVQGV